MLQSKNSIEACRYVLLTKRKVLTKREIKMAGY